MFTASKVTLWKPKIQSSVDSEMCTEHSMLRKNISVGLIHANTAAYVINYQGMCTNAHFQWQMTDNLNK